MDSDIFFIWTCCCFTGVFFLGAGFGLFWLIQRSRSQPDNKSLATKENKQGEAASASSDLLDFNYFIKYSVLVMSLPYLHRNYQDISTPHYLNWLNQWLQPEFELDYDAGSAEMSLSLIANDKRRVIYSGDFRHFPSIDIVNTTIKSFNEQQQRRLMRGIDDFEAAPPERNPIEAAFLDLEFDDAALIKLDGILLDEWESAMLAQDETIQFDEIKPLIKFLTVSTLLPLVETGKLNLALNTFFHWLTMWLYPDLGLLILSKDPEAIMLLRFDDDKHGPICRTPLFSLYDCLYFAKKFASLSPELREIVVSVTKRYLTQLPIPPVSYKAEPEARQEYEALIESTVIITPPIKLAEKERGIGMLDTGIAGLWHTVQFFKCILTRAFLNDVKENRLIVEGVHDFDSCSRWCQQWLRPHWDLEVTRNSGGELEMKLYPLQDRGTREQVYYHGTIASFISKNSPVPLDMQRYDYSQRYADVVQQLRRAYGSAYLGEDGEVTGEGLIKIEIDDPNLLEKVAHNDEYILEYFL